MWAPLVAVVGRINATTNFQKPGKFLIIVAYNYNGHIIILHKTISQLHFL